MVFPIKQIAINLSKQQTEQQDHQSFHNYPISDPTSFTLLPLNNEVAQHEHCFSETSASPTIARGMTPHSVLLPVTQLHGQRQSTRRCPSQ